jgi:hypothetical protein
VDVGVRARQRISAVLAYATRPWLRSRTHEALPKPEREALLADAGRAVQEQRARQGVSTDGIVEPLAEHLMAMNGEQRHARKLRQNTDATNCSAARIVTIRLGKITVRRHLWNAD